MLQEYKVEAKNALTLYSWYSSPGRSAVAVGRGPVGTGQFLGLGLVGAVLGLFGLDHEGDGAYAVVVLDVHHPHALGRAAHLRDAANRGALDHAVLGDEEEVLVLADDQGAGEAALLLGQLRGQH